MTWRKSSYSGSQGGNCVEVNSWRKSSHSLSGHCVETAHGPGAVGIRDSRLGDASLVLEVPAATWRAFLRKMH
jgi:hypothetical protein